MDDVIGIILLVVTIISQFTCCGDDVIICGIMVSGLETGKKI